MNGRCTTIRAIKIEYEWGNLITSIRASKAEKEWKLVTTKHGKKKVLHCVSRQEEIKMVPGILSYNDRVL